METWEAITSRRNVRSYKDEPVPKEQLDRILEAGRRAPSSQNWQPWDFVLVTQRRRLEELARVWGGAGHVARSAATIALVTDAATQERARFDLGQATMAMMLAAADLGIGSGHASVSDQELARELLGFPEDKVCAFLIAFGVPADRPLRPVQRPDRKPFDEVVHRERW
ncbi:nitroreductase family protein [Actinomadura sp. SCN-SB]|uniref:nitroreductase family protein n=1 Tax=Actinomadura sp. SCN-SB TaxID=3373092 RepID=UPI003750EBAA